MKKIVPIALIVTAALILTFATSGQAAGLEKLFAGFENSCKMNPQFWQFHKSLVRKKDNPNRGSFYLPGTPRLPNDIHGSLGRIQLKVEDVATVARLPLRGNFYNLPVIEYEGWFCHCGISAMQFTVNAPISTVQNVLRQKGLRITGSYSEFNDNNIIKAQLIAKENRTIIVCNWSD